LIVSIILSADPLSVATYLHNKSGSIARTSMVFDTLLAAYWALERFDQNIEDMVGMERNSTPFTGSTLERVT
jgi:hypothetical protein